jgi:predicted SAM-dependent methyltransferase
MRASYHWGAMISRWVKLALRRAGIDVRRRAPSINASYSGDVTGGRDRIHYGCGTILLDGWLNVDLHVDTVPGKSLRLNVTERHPFPDDTFRFGFSEDFFEHLDQPDQIIFLTEAFRTLKPGGCLRLSCPSLDGVLKIHYAPPKLDAALAARHDAYEQHEHRHFPAKEELRLMGLHVGFREVEFRDYRESPHPELANLEVREIQRPVNLYAELKK